MTQPNEHRNRVAVITGGSGGIGGAIAQRLFDEGAIVHVLNFLLSERASFITGQLIQPNGGQVMW